MGCVLNVDKVKVEDEDLTEQLLLGDLFQVSGADRRAD